MEDCSVSENRSQEPNRKSLLWEPWMSEKDFELRMFFYGTTASQVNAEAKENYYYDFE